VLFRLGRVIGVREPGLRLIVPVIDVLRRVSLRIVTMPIQSQGIITRDNVSVDVSAVAHYRVVDATKAVVAIENVAAAINQIAQTTLRKVVGQHTREQAAGTTPNTHHASQSARRPGQLPIARRGAVGIRGGLQHRLQPSGRRSSPAIP
jgi:regulator of protease activity HflC (stomatin/prohibitin superfamily)